MKQETFPVLYILMRSDITSMNPGKAMAQASHASNAMVHKIRKGGKVPSKELTALLNKWESDTKQGFGTCLVLDAGNEAAILETLKELKEFERAVGSKNAVYAADIINDPTYPIRDGDITHYISFNTCGYVFLDKNSPIAELLRNFELHA